MQLLTNDDWCARFCRSLDKAIVEEQYRLAAFVLMPEHVHLLVLPTLHKPDLGLFLARIKQPYSSEIKQILVAQASDLLKRLTVRERPGKFCFRYWQEGAGFDRNLYSPKAIQASLDYIHNNPVKRKLCLRAVDWKWSSARYYLSQPPCQQYEDLPLIHGLPSGALG